MVLWPSRNWPLWGLPIEFFLSPHYHFQAFFLRCISHTLSVWWSLHPRISWNLLFSACHDQPSRKICMFDTLLKLDETAVMCSGDASVKRSGTIGACISGSGRWLQLETSFAPGNFPRIGGESAGRAHKLCVPLISVLESRIGLQILQWRSHVVPQLNLKVSVCFDEMNLPLGKETNMGWRLQRHLGTWRMFGSCSAEREVAHPP